jgi:hypothetical protein
MPTLNEVPEVATLLATILTGEPVPSRKSSDAMICILRTDPLYRGHGPMVRNPRWDTEKLSSHAPRAGARESGASAATRRMEGARTPAAADGDGPDLLGFPI